MKKLDSIPFLTDDGEQVEFSILEQTTINGKNYLLVKEAGDQEESDEDLVYIMRECPGADGDMVSYEFVEEDEELGPVSKVFEQLLEDLNIEVE